MNFKSIFNKYTVKFVRFVSQFFVFGILCLLFILQACKQNTEYYLTDYPGIEEKNVLRIVTNLNPIDYFVSGDSIVGFNYDVLKALENYAPSIEFKVSLENSLDKSIDGLKNGQYDLIARNIPIHSNDRSGYCLTVPIVRNKLVLIQRKSEFNNNIPVLRNHLKLANETIYVTKNSPSIFRLKNLSSEIGDSIHIVENSVYEDDQLAMMVATGEIKFAICSDKTAQRMAEKIPELDIKTDIGFTHFEGWAVRESSPILLDSINSWIERFTQTTHYKTIYKRYYQ